MTRSFSAPAFQGDQFCAHALRDCPQIGLPEVLGEKVQFDPGHGNDAEPGLLFAFLHFAAFPVEDLSRHGLRTSISN
jgi:hypothetical protein